MLWPAIFWSGFALLLFSFLLYRVLIPFHFNVEPNSARLIWSFVTDVEHPARWTSTGFVELFVGWMCFRQFQRNGLDRAVLQWGRLDAPAIGLTIAGALFLPDIVVRLIQPVLEAVGIDASAAYRDGETGIVPAHQLLGFFLSAILIAPVIEEFLYRGVFISTALAAKWSPLLVIATSSAAFTIIHGQYTVMGLIAIFLMGCGFGWLRVWSGGLGLAMLAHWVINMKVFLLSLLLSQQSL